MRGLLRLGLFAARTAARRHLGTNAQKKLSKQNFFSTHAARNSLQIQSSSVNPEVNPGRDEILECDMSAYSRAQALQNTMDACPALHMFDLLRGVVVYTLHNKPMDQIVSEGGFHCDSDVFWTGKCEEPGVQSNVIFSLHPEIMLSESPNQLPARFMSAVLLRGLVFIGEGGNTLLVPRCLPLADSSLVTRALTQRTNNIYGLGKTKMHPGKTTEECDPILQNFLAATELTKFLPTFGKAPAYAIPEGLETELGTAILELAQKEPDCCFVESPLTGVAASL